MLTDYKELGQIPGFWGSHGGEERMGAEWGENERLVTEPQESWLPLLSTLAYRGYQYKPNYVALE